MQIASQPSEAAAQSSYQDLARRYGGVLEGREVNIVKAEIAGKGTFWRVRVPAEQPQRRDQPLRELQGRRRQLFRVAVASLPRDCDEEEDEDRTARPRPRRFSFDSQRVGWWCRRP